MLTIENVEALHLRIGPETQGALASAIAAAVLKEVAVVEEDVQTSGAAPAIGEIWPAQAGIFAGTMPARYGKAGYHLILGAESPKQLEWGPYNHDVPGAKDHHDGVANTRALLADAKEHPAAAWAASWRDGGFEDWYLPAHNELMLMWISAPHLFKREGWYWSSTQYSPSNAWAQDFEYGRSDFSSKDNELRAVAVRRLSL